MPVQNHQVRSKKIVMGLELELSGMSITVKAGPVVMAGASGGLPSDETITLPVVPYARSVRIYLVKDKSTGEFSVLLDDYIRDGVDVRWAPQPDDSFETLEPVALGSVPADSSDLSEGEWITWSIGPGEAA